MRELFPEPMPLPSLTYYDEFIDWADEYVLLEKIDAQPWSDSLRNRRVQHYGFVYDYHTGRADTPAPEIPSWIPNPGFDFNQVIINEYEPGQGIAAHTDAPCYDDKIASLSLGSGLVMVFRGPGVPDNMGPQHNVWLDPRSLLIMEGEARHDFTHSIPARLSDYGTKRKRRVSITYRTLIVSE